MTSNASLARKIWALANRPLPRNFVACLLFIPLAALTYLNIASFTDLPEAGEEHKRDALARLTFLERALHEGDAIQDMQDLFPEGGCFLASLYGLAWANIARRYPEDARLLEKAKKETAYALMIQDRPDVVAVFVDTQVRRGIFWMGQRNILLGSHLELLPETERSQDLVEEFHRNSQEVAGAFLQSHIHHLDTYPSQCWPADNATALAALTIHDRLYGTQHSTAYQAWKSWTLEHLDPETGMVAGEIDSVSGQVLQPARGCAASWSLAILADSDPSFVAEQYALYREQFGIRRFGFHMFREFPPGSDLKADVDSGPIILGAGVAATGIGLGAAIANGDQEMATDIHRLSVMFGLPVKNPLSERASKRFLLGLLPMGDAFLAWGISMMRPDEAPIQSGSVLAPAASRLSFHLISLALAFLLLYRLRVLFRAPAAPRQKGNHGP